MTVVLPPVLLTTASPDLETVWSFLARTEPAVLEIMMDPVAGLAEEERHARRHAKEMGVAYLTVPAPQALQEEGLGEVGVYPQAVLDRTFPVDP